MNGRIVIDNISISKDGYWIALRVVNPMGESEAKAFKVAEEREGKGKQEKEIKSRKKKVEIQTAYTSLEIMCVIRK
jgi:hypothetical protein